MDSPLQSPGGTSAAARAPGVDGRRDDRDDLRRDEISAFQYESADASDVGLVEEPLDEFDRADMKAHKKWSEVWSHSQKRVALRRAQREEEKPSLTTLRTDALLLRNAAIPNAVWTVGDSTHGQCGHTGKDVTPDTPHPASLELQTLRDGVGGLFAGPYCTLVVTKAGNAIGFGSGPFRSATEAAAEAAAASFLAYEGAPPFRVLQPAGLEDAFAQGGEAHGSYSATVLMDARSARRAPLLTTPWVVGCPYMICTLGSTLEHRLLLRLDGLPTWQRLGRAAKHPARCDEGAVRGGRQLRCGEGGGGQLLRQDRGGGAREHSAARGREVDARGADGAQCDARRPGGDGRGLLRRAHAERDGDGVGRRRGGPTRTCCLRALSFAAGLSRPPALSCAANLSAALIFAGEEGKLGLGQPASQSRPTIVDFLLPTNYVEVAKAADNRDELLKAGSRLIHTRGKAFKVTSPSTL